MSKEPARPAEPAGGGGARLPAGPAEEGEAGEDEHKAFVRPWNMVAYEDAADTASSTAPEQTASYRVPPDTVIRFRFYASGEQQQRNYYTSEAEKDTIQMWQAESRQRMRRVRDEEDERQRSVCRALAGQVMQQEMVLKRLEDNTETGIKRAFALAMADRLLKSTSKKYDDGDCPRILGPLGDVIADIIPGVGGMRLNHPAAAH
jgi:hypothetical protein